MPKILPFSRPHGILDSIFQLQLRLALCLMLRLCFDAMESSLWKINHLFANIQQAWAWYHQMYHCLMKASLSDSICDLCLALSFSYIAQEWDHQIISETFEPSFCWHLTLHSSSCLTKTSSTPFFSYLFLVVSLISCSQYGWLSTLDFYLQYLRGLNHLDLMQVSRFSLSLCFS